MATKKAKPAAAVSKAVTTRSIVRVVAQPAVPAASENGIPQRLLREAAWSRMFGRADTKNPFTR
jgi:hypothetical protein